MQAVAAAMEATTEATMAATMEATMEVTTAVTTEGTTEVVAVARLVLPFGVNVVVLDGEVRLVASLEHVGLRTSGTLSVSREAFQHEPASLLTMRRITGLNTYSFLRKKSLSPPDILLNKLPFWRIFQKPPLHRHFRLLALDKLHRLSCLPVVQGPIPQKVGKRVLLRVLAWVLWPERSKCPLVQYTFARADLLHCGF